MRKWFEVGGIVAAVVLIVFGAVASELKQQQIVGTPDMTPAAIKAEAAKAGLKNISFPTQSVANKRIDSGARARVFAEYMRIHALEATGGYVYAQMGIYVAKAGTPTAQLMPGGGTDNKAYAQIDPKTQQPVSNGARNVWVTETALTTALNTSYMASQLALFGIVVFTPDFKVKSAGRNASCHFPSRPFFACSASDLTTIVSDLACCACEAVAVVAVTSTPATAATATRYHE